MSDTKSFSENVLLALKWTALSALAGMVILGATVGWFFPDDGEFIHIIGGAIGALIYMVWQVYQDEIPS